MFIYKKKYKNIYWAVNITYKWKGAGKMETFTFLDIHVSKFEFYDDLLFL